MTESRKDKAIQKYVDVIGGSYSSIGMIDVDYKVMDSLGNLIGYVSIVEWSDLIRTSLVLSAPLRDIVKLSDKRLNPVIVWACDDGIVYANLWDIKGVCKFGSGRRRSELDDMYAHYDRQKSMRYIRY